MRKNWSCLIDVKGDMLEWEDKTGADYLSSFTQVIGYARALLYSSKENVTFFYYKEDCALWFRISLQRHKQEFTLLQAEQTPLPFELSKRELEILTLLSSGLSNTEIAAQLYISERTVAKHIEHLFQKTAIDNRTALAVFAVTENLYCLPFPENLTSSLLSGYEIEQLIKQGNKLPEKALFNIKKDRGRPIVIGIPYVEQGLGQIDTKELLNGSLLAIDRINCSGGINGRQVKVAQVGFNVSDKNSIWKAYHRLFEQEVDAISTSYACYSADIHELAAGKGIPYLHIASHSSSDKLAQNLSTAKIDNMFQVCASDINYGRGILRFLNSYQRHYPDLIKNKHLLIIQVRWQKIDIGIEELILKLRALHWRVEVIELSQTPDAFAYAVNQIHNLSPAIIALASYFAEDMVAFYHEFIKQPINAVLYSIYAPSAFLPHEQPCEGVLWSTTSGLSPNHAGKQFYRHYQQFFGYQPSYSQASIAYDQINILANVWRQATSPRAFKEVNNGIRSLPYYGVNGTYFFGTESQIGLVYPDDTDDLSISQPHLVFQIQQGHSRVIAPDLFAESMFRLPPWFNLKQT